MTNKTFQQVIEEATANIQKLAYIMHGKTRVLTAVYSNAVSFDIEFVIQEEQFVNEALAKRFAAFDIYKTLVSQYKLDLDQLIKDLQGFENCVWYCSTVVIEYGSSLGQWCASQDIQTVKGGLSFINMVVGNTTVLKNKIRFQIVFQLDFHQPDKWGFLEGWKKAICTNDLEHILKIWDYVKKCSKLLILKHFFRK